MGDLGRNRSPRPPVSAWQRETSEAKSIPGGCKSLQRLRGRKAGKGGSGCLVLHLWARVAGPTLLPLLKCCSFVSSAESGLRAPNTELCPALPACSRSCTGGSRCSDVSQWSGSSSGGKSLGSSFQSPREPGWRGGWRRGQEGSEVPVAVRRGLRRLSCGRRSAPEPVLGWAQEGLGQARGWKGPSGPCKRSHSRSPAEQWLEPLERGRVPGRAQMVLSDEFKAFSFPSVCMNGEWPLVVGTDDQPMG